MHQHPKIKLGEIGVLMIQTDKPFYCLKDLANLMVKHPRTVRRWCKRLSVPPLATSGGNRWTRAMVEVLLLRYANYKRKSLICQNWRNGVASAQG